MPHFTLGHATQKDDAQENYFSFARINNTLNDKASFSET